MTQNTKIWIWIAVAAIVIAGLGVSGFFLLKKDEEQKNNGGENAKFTPKGNNSNSGSNTSGAGNNSTTSDTEDKNTNTLSYAKAVKLKESIYFFLGTDTGKLKSVLNSVESQEEWDEILANYLVLTGESFKKQLSDEWGLSKNAPDIYRKILTDKGIEPKF